MSPKLQRLEKHWKEVEPVLRIRNESDYKLAITQLNELIDEVGTDKAHPLYELLDTLGTVIHAYEDQHIRLPEVTGAEVLQSLMAEHGITQSELQEVGSQGVVSEILNGKRELNLRQIKALSERFGVSPAVFIS